MVKSAYCLAGVMAAGLVWGTTRSSDALAHDVAGAARDTPEHFVIHTAPFEEPLIATGQTTQAEDAALLHAIEVYRFQPAKDDLTVFDRFLQDHPNSGWRIALLANMGLLDYHFGYFSRALTAWQTAWEEGRANTDPLVKALVDRVAGEELRMHARLGHADAIAALIADIGQRKLTGQATEELSGARDGLWEMRNNPGVAYLCGPLALKSLLQTLQTPPKERRFLDDYRSGPEGVSLAEVGQLAAKTGLNYRLVYRTINQPIPVPSIVYWNIRHFAAVVESNGERYHIKDPTFGADLWVSVKAMNSESSGYFLIPSSVVKGPWAPVPEAKALTLRGM